MSSLLKYYDCDEFFFENIYLHEKIQNADTRRHEYAYWFFSKLGKKIRKKMSKDNFGVFKIKTNQLHEIPYDFKNNSVKKIIASEFLNSLKLRSNEVFIYFAVSSNDVRLIINSNKNIKQFTAIENLLMQLRQTESIKLIPLVE